MPMTTTTRAIMLGCLLIPCNASLGGEREIIASIEAFFQATEQEREASLVQSIESDPDYDRAKVGDWLHRAKLFPNQAAGERMFNIELDHGEYRSLLISIPADYTPDRPWPLIISYHGNGSGEAYSLARVKRLLGDRIDEYVVVCPGNAGQDIIDAVGEPSVEHPLTLRTIKELFHIDSDRVYVWGKSAGGFMAWTLATLHADMYAGVMPLGCAYSIPAYIDGLWETMLSNVSNLPMIHVWGGKDGLKCLQVLGVPENPTIAAMNSVLTETVNRLGLDNVLLHRMPDNRHSGMTPPADAFARFMSSSRNNTPKTIHHRFRYIYQSSAYWLEGHTWVGEQWRSESLLFLDILQGGEEKRQEMGRMIHDRLGGFDATHEGQVFDIKRRHVGEMTLWIGSDMVDWETPVKVSVDGAKVHDAILTPYLGVCLAQAKRTRDFDRLRWAGLRIDGDGTAIPVTMNTIFPPLRVMEKYAGKAGAGN